MTIESLEKVKSIILSRYVKRLIVDSEKLTEHWEKSKTVYEFKDNVWNDSSLDYSYEKGIIFKYNEDFTRKIFNQLKHTENAVYFKTYSDRGSLKIGNSSFNILIPNGYGDGEMEVVIIEQGVNINDGLFNFFTTIQGDFIDIYDYDSNEDVSNDLYYRIESGEYAVYSSNGYVVLQKIRN